MKKIIGIGVLILVFIGVFLVFQRRNVKMRYSPSGNALKTIRVGNETLEVEVVATAEKIALGLSGRDSMCESCGMLFVFSGEDHRRFWMKDMKFDLDMLWIRGGQVAHIAKNVPHEKGTEEVVAPEIKVDKILELNSGTSDRLGIKVGDIISF